MIFNTDKLNLVLDAWCTASVAAERACGHNLAFDEKISADRVADVKSFVDSTHGIDELRRGLIDHYRQRTYFDPIPQAFLEINGLALILSLSPEQKLLRLENLTQPLLKSGLNVGQLEEAIRKADRPSLALIEWFCREWNERPDIRRNPVSFSAFKDENIPEFESSDWANLFRIKLGLAHYTGLTGDVPVALMEYTADDIIASAKRDYNATAFFAIPTSVDGEPYFQFFPTPHEMPFGSPMPLVAIQSEADLVAELLHPRLHYQAKHVSKIGVIRASVSDSDLVEMRNNQLMALRLQSGRDDFGREL